MEKCNGCHGCAELTPERAAEQKRVHELMEKMDGFVTEITEKFPEKQEIVMKRWQNLADRGVATIDEIEEFVRKIETDMKEIRGE